MMIGQSIFVLKTVLNPKTLRSSAVSSTNREINNTNHCMENFGNSLKTTTIFNLNLYSTVLNKVPFFRIQRNTVFGFDRGWVVYIKTDSQNAERLSWINTSLRLVSYKIYQKIWAQVNFTELFLKFCNGVIMLSPVFALSTWRQRRYYFLWLELS